MTETEAAESGEMSVQVPLSSITYATVHVILTLWAPKNLEMVGSEFRERSALANYASYTACGASQLCGRGQALRHANGIVRSSPVQ